MLGELYIQRVPFDEAILCRFLERIRFHRECL